MYRVVTDDHIQHQLDALPAPALAAFAELRVLLEVNPWASGPVNPANPHGPVRTMSFGPGHEGVAAYLILESRAQGRSRADRLDSLTVLTWPGTDLATLGGSTSRSPREGPSSRA